MIILPAIDIQQGACVRLVQGDFSTAEQVADDFLETGRAFRRAGAEWVHMVDLDGAREGRPVNSAMFFTMAGESGLKVEAGGGIRSMAQVENCLKQGVTRVILGTAALSDPKFVREAVVEFGKRVVVGIDAANQMAAAEGWISVSQVHYIELAKRMEDIGVTTIVYTDISKDGTLTGPSLDQLEQLSRAVSCRLIASGGIRDLEHIKRLSQMGLYGAICGKSLYRGTLDLAEAIGTAACNASVTDILAAACGASVTDISAAACGVSSHDISAAASGSSATGISATASGASSQDISATASGPSAEDRREENPC